MLRSKADTDVRERHVCAHFMDEAQSRPDRVPIESQYEAHSRPIGKTPQTMKTQHNQIVNMISLHILLLDIAKLSCFLNGPRMGLVMGLDWASTGPRLGLVLVLFLFAPSTRAHPLPHRDLDSIIIINQSINQSSINQNKCYARLSHTKECLPPFPCSSMLASINQNKCYARLSHTKECLPPFPCSSMLV